MDGSSSSASPTKIFGPVAGNGTIIFIGNANNLITPESGVITEGQGLISRPEPAAALCRATAFCHSRLRPLRHGTAGTITLNNTSSSPAPPARPPAGRSQLIGTSSSKVPSPSMAETSCSAFRPHPSACFPCRTPPSHYSQPTTRPTSPNSSTAPIPSRSAMAENSSPPRRHA